MGIGPKHHYFCDTIFNWELVTVVAICLGSREGRYSKIRAGQRNVWVIISTLTLNIAHKRIRRHIKCDGYLGAKGLYSKTIVAYMGLGEVELSYTKIARLYNDIVYTSQLTVPWPEGS